MGSLPIQSHDAPAFKATIEVLSHAIKKNSRPIFRNQKTNRPFIGKTQRLRDAEDFLVQELRSRANAFGLFQPISTRLRCVLHFGFPPNVYYTAKLKESRRTGDCSNLSQIVEDALQKSGIIVNDWQLAPITIDRVCTPTTQVHIELYENDK